MISDIIDAIAAHVKDMGVFEKVGGLATPTEVLVGDQRKILPSAKNIITDEYDFFVPDDATGGMCFFEAGESTPKRVSGRTMQLSCEASLIFWVNGDYQLSGKFGQLTRHLAGIINFMDIEIHGVTGVSLTFLGDTLPGPANFAKYSFNEAENHLCFPPYFAGGIKFRVTYVISQSCLSEINIAKTGC